MPKPVTVEYAPILSLCCMVIGILLLILGSIGELGMYDLGSGLSLWIIILSGILFLVIGGFWFSSFVRKVRKFRKLMGEKSKAMFVRNLDDIEYLAWQLPTRYEEEVLKRKRDFKIK